MWGLMKAVKRFDPDRSVRFISFAVYWIKAEIHEYVMQNFKLVKMSKSKVNRKLFFNLRRLKNKSQDQSAETQIAHISQELGVTKDQVRQMEEYMYGSSTSFEASLGDEEGEYSPADFLQDNSFDPALVYEQESSIQAKKNLVRNFIGNLDERTRDIIQKRWIEEEKTTLQDLSHKYNVSIERIRQIEALALKKLEQASRKEGIVD